MSPSLEGAKFPAKVNLGLNFTAASAVALVAVFLIHVFFPPKLLAFENSNVNHTISIVFVCILVSAMIFSIIFRKLNEQAKAYLAMVSPCGFGFDI